MRRITLVALVLVGLAAFTASTPAKLPAKPDLYVEMPTKPYNDHVAPIYVDAFTKPGHLLYRFDTVVRNQGGTLDLYRDPQTEHAIQAIWSSGVPSTPPNPVSKPAGPGLTLEDRSKVGAVMGYAVEPSHQHWHFYIAASYRLLVPGHSPRVMPKVGFCMHDTYAAAKYFSPDVHGGGEDPWCAPDDQNATFVRMGLSQGAGDLYDAATDLQFVDVTGLAPGHYTIKATANPFGHIDETDRSNNTLTQVRLIPGVLASAVRAFAMPGTPATIPLAATIIAPQVPARSSAECQPQHTGGGCYTRTTAAGALDFVLLRGASHGTATVGPTGKATYTPAATGSDTFTYAATDPRGLKSLPATVTVTVGSKPQVVRSALVRQSGATATAAVSIGSPAVIAATVTGAKRFVHALKPIQAHAGSVQIALGRLVPGSYTARLVVRSGSSSQALLLSFVLA